MCCVNTAVVLILNNIKEKQEYSGHHTLTLKHTEQNIRSNIWGSGLWGDGGCAVSCSVFTET